MTLCWHLLYPFTHELITWRCVSLCYRYSQAASMIGSSAVFICETVSRHQEDYGYFQLTTLGIAVIAWLCMRYTGNNAHTEYDLQNQNEAKVESAVTGSDDTRGAKTNHSKSVVTLTWQILKERDFVSFVLTNFCQIYHYTFLSNFVAIICDAIIPYDVVSLKIRSIYYGALFLMPQVKSSMIYVTQTNYKFDVKLDDSFLQNIKTLKI